MKTLDVLKDFWVVLCLIGSAIAPATSLGLVATTSAIAVSATMTMTITSPAEARSCRSYMREAKQRKRKGVFGFAISSDKKDCGWSGNKFKSRSAANRKALSNCNKLAQKRGVSCKVIK